MFARFALAAALAALAGTAPAQSLRATKVLAPDATEVLAEGPIPVTFTYFKDNQQITAAGTLQFLTRKAFYLRDADGELAVCETGTGHSKYGRVTTIETQKSVPVGNGAVEKRAWTRAAVPGSSPARFQYDGKPLPPPAVEIKPAAVPDKSATAAENWLLYCALEQLQSRLDAALLGGDAGAGKGCAEQTKRTVAYLTAAPGADPKLKAGYEQLAGYVKSQEENRRAVKKLIEEQEGLAKGLQQRFQDAQSALLQRQASAASNPFSLFGGSFALSQAMYAFQAERERIQVALTSFSGQAKAQYERLTDAFESLRKDRWAAIRKIGLDRYGLPVESPFEALRGLTEQKATAEEILALLAKRVDLDREFGKAAGAGDNPFALCDLYAALANGVPGGKDRGGKLFEFALKMADATKLLPAGAVFDFDRAELLRAAAAMACQAAVAETPKGAWSLARSPRAAYALRLLELTGVLDAAQAATADPSGLLREQIAVAWLLLGQTEEAYRQADVIEKVRKGSPLSRVAIARMLAAREKRTPADALRAIAILSEAFKDGYTDTDEVWQSLKPKDVLRPDFVGLRAAPKSKKSPTEYEQLLQQARALVGR